MDWISKIPVWLASFALTAIGICFVYVAIARPAHFEFAGLGFGAQSQSSTEFPRNSVVAFDDTSLGPDKCPAGWSPFLEARSRTIIGAGDPENAPGKLARDQNGRPLPDLVLRQHGGEIENRLNVRNLPQHTHYLSGGSDAADPAGPLNEGNQIKRGAFPGGHDPTYVLRGTSEQAQYGLSSAVGGDEPINNMPPFIALYYCKKD